MQKNLRNLRHFSTQLHRRPLKAKKKPKKNSRLNCLAQDAIKIHSMRSLTWSVAAALCPSPQVHSKYRRTGASFSKAQQEFSQGVLTNRTVQTVAADAATSAAQGAVGRSRGNWAVSLDPPCLRFISSFLNNISQKKKKKPCPSLLLQPSQSEDPKTKYESIRLFLPA